MFGIEKQILLNIEMKDKAILVQYYHTTSKVFTNYTFQIC